MSQSSLEIPSYNSESIRSYWDEKYLTYKDVWGPHPSTAAKLVMEYMIQNQHYQGRILDLGCGYGRDSAYFHQNGLEVIGVDMSSKGIQMARTLFPDQQFLQLNFQKHSFPKHHFKYIYANFFFHLIPEHPIRCKMISTCYEILTNGGLLFATVSSKNDHDYLNGTKVADNIVKNKRNVLKVFYDLALIHHEFDMFDTIKNIQFSEEHTHDTPHSHENHLVIGKKR